MQEQVRVIHSRPGFVPKKVYDVEIMVPVVYRDKYLRRLEHFKRCGFFNLADLEVHLTLVGSLADWPHRQSLKFGWPESFHVSVLAVNDEGPLPKVSAAYLWLRDDGPQARWFLRVDDDSMTDLGGLLAYADRRYANSAVHLMTSPYFNDHTNGPFIGYLHGKGIHLPIYANEHESSLTSCRAMHGMFTHPPAVEFLEFTCQVFDSQSDKCLPLSMLVAGMPVAINPVSTKDFLPDKLTLSGGNLSHIHYVDWEDPVFAPLATAFLYGHRQPFVVAELDELLNRPMIFGRCLGKVLAELTLLPNGVVRGAWGPEEAKWDLANGLLRFTRPNGIVTTIFDTILRHESHAWLIGPYLHESYIHFLRLT